MRRTHDEPARTSHQLRRRRPSRKDHQHVLGIESDYVVNYCFPEDWPTDREVRARIIGGWLQAEAQYLA